NILFVERDAVYDSAAAFLLARSPRNGAVVSCDGGEAEVSQDSAYVVARFNGADNSETAMNQGLELAQAGLDLMSIMGTADLFTQKSTEEYLLSWRTEGQQVVRIHSTTTLSFTVNSPTISVRDLYGNEVTKEPTIPAHHLAFRYFRLSQTSDDLYDAFRNMYLSFELLLSSKHPPRSREREREWLERGIASADQDLDLGKFLRPKPQNLVHEIIERVYTSARLPLFHAKAGRCVLAPHGSEEKRQKLFGALELLTQIVLAMTSSWYGARRLGGGVCHAWVYQNLRESYKSGRVLALQGNEPFRKDERDLSHERYASAVEMNTKVKDDPDDPRAPLLIADVEVSSLWLGELTQIAVVGPESPMLDHAIESPLSLEGFNRLEYVDKAAIENVRQPKRRFAR
ncbi:MAG: hypothetical protein ACNY01_13200, partial [Desulfobacteria bacterium]